MLRRNMLLTGGALALASRRVSAEDAWPARPVRLVVPYPPGGGADILARLVMRHVSQQFGQAVVIENRAGANTIIGTEQIVRSAPDGYNFVIGSSALPINPLLYRRLPFDPERDLVPVALLAVIPFVLVVSPSLAVRSVDDLIALAKATPGGLMFGSFGAGSSSHLTGLLFAKAAGIELTHVAYPGSAPVLPDLIAGRVAFAFSTILPAMPEIRNGRLRPVAVTAPGRVVHAPAGTPNAAVTRMNREVLTALDQADVQKFLTDQGYVIPARARNTPAELAALHRADADRWGRIIREADIRLD